MIYEKVEIETENIQVDQFLKWEGIVETGGQVKLLIEDKMIYVNEKLETARRRRLFNGDRVSIVDGGAWEIAAPEK